MEEGYPFILISHNARAQPGIWEEIRLSEPTNRYLEKQIY